MFDGVFGVLFVIGILCVTVFGVVGVFGDVAVRVGSCVCIKCLLNVICVLFI